MGASKGGGQRIKTDGLGRKYIMSDKLKFVISNLKEDGKVTEYRCKKSEFLASVLLKYKPNIGLDYSD